MKWLHLPSFFFPKQCPDIYLVFHIADPARRKLRPCDIIYHIEELAFRWKPDSSR